MLWLLYAALAAVCFGLRGILYHWTSQKPLDRNVMLLGVYMSGALVSALFALLLRESWTPAVWAGVSMGIFSFVSNAAMFRGFAVGKASLVAIFTALTPIVVVAASYVLWHETLNLAQSASFVIILAGIVMIRYSNDISWGNLKGAEWALLAMVAFGITDLSSKQAMLWGADKLPTLFVMYATGSLLFGASWLRARQAARRLAAVRGSAAGELAAAAVSEAAVGELAAEGLAPAKAKAAVRWTTSRTIWLGMVVGLSNISGMLLILPAFELGVTGLVSAVIATNVLLILLYARLVLKEVWTRMEFAGILTAIVGVLLLRLLG
ncbi:EamA family transporter [Paenibacillus koleovorans]|uniref:EamA family transporter n=1 Tax=Paenibacillus koleovorans TaxID=121608 RepID=UPI000FDB9240|nr:EamA family transporter [Paenibacillus koleovorans]